MTQPNPSTALGRSVVDELARRGVRLAVISPGSRSTALALAAAEHPLLRTVVAVDERSAGFHALGHSKGGGGPAVAISTSGTAAANFLPAVVEADASGSPLVVLTADRPVELRGVGANQTIDQVHLFGNRTRHFADIPAPNADEDLADSWRSAVADAVHRALGGWGRPPGPSHLNIAFREPTVPVPDDGRSSSPAYPFSIERDGPTDVGDLWDASEPEPGLADLPPVSRGIIIAGDGRYDRTALLAEAGRLGFPVLATALSGLRGADVVHRYHHILAAGTIDGLQPDLVVAVGAIGPSDRLGGLVAGATTRIRVDYWGRVIDPGRNATHRVVADPVALLAAMSPGRDGSFRGSWESMNSIVDGVTAKLAEDHPNTGPGVAHALSKVGWGALVVASSLPIRDVDAHLDRAGKVIANRGASGIDGFVSTALGVAGVVERTAALSGDLSLLHDSNGFLADGLDDLVLVVVDNGGGGLFDNLPQASHAPDFERLFIAGQNRDLALLAAFHGLAYAVCDDAAGLHDVADAALSIGGRHLIRVPVDRRSDVAIRRDLDDTARAVVS